MYRTNLILYLTNSRLQAVFGVPIRKIENRFENCIQTINMGINLKPPYTKELLMYLYYIQTFIFNIFVKRFFTHYLNEI